MPILLDGCAVALGPGFHFASRQTVIQPGAPLHVRVTDQLVNAGTRPLSYLDVLLPENAGSIAVTMDGRMVSARLATSQPGSALRIPFEPPWPQKQSRSFVLNYDIASDSSRAAATASDQNFHVASPDLLPRWVPPPGVFVTADSPQREEFEFAAPATARVTAAGRERRRSKQGERTVHRFRVTPDDFPLFIAAGRYEETLIRAGKEGRPVIFWTLPSLAPEKAKPAAERLAQTVDTFEKAFGPLASGHPAIRIVVMAAPQDAPVGNDATSAFTFPYGVILDDRLFNLEQISEQALEAAESGLAATWFGWTIRLPAAGPDNVFGLGARRFAVITAAAAREGESARSQAVRQLLADYDRANAPTALPGPASANVSGALDAEKAALFWIALEDLAGTKAVQAAIQHLILALAGNQVTIGDLRAAIEGETRSSAVGFFREWIDRPGVPADFRARYSPASRAGATSNTPLRAASR